MSSQSIALISAVFFISSFVQSVSGFGSAIVAMSILTLFFPVKFATPLVLPIGTIITLTIFLKLRKHFDYKKLKPLLIGTIFGVPTGALFLARADEQTIKRILAFLLFSYGFFSLTGKKKIELELTPKWGYLAGFFAGCLGGAFSTSGPPVVIYTSVQKWSTGDCGGW